MIPMPMGLFNEHMSGYDPRYVAVVNRAVSEGFALPSANTMQQGSNFIQHLDSVGIWDRLDLLFVFATDNSDFGRINWKNPTGNLATYTNAPTFTPRKGFRSLGATSYIDTGFNCATNGVNYVQNDASRYMWVDSVDLTTALITDAVLDGVASGSQNNMFGGLTGAQRINSGTNTSSPTIDFTGPGMIGLNRISATQIRAHKNKVNLGLATTTSSVKLSENQVLFRRQTNYNTIGSMISIYMIGGSLTTAQNDQCYDAMNEYMSNVIDPDYKAVLDRATSLGYMKPSIDQQTKQNNLVLALKSAGIWSKLDVFYMFATNGDQNFATLNWKNPSLYQSTLYNSPTFTTDAGFKGDGVAAYIDTNYNPAINGVNYTLNNASRFMYVRTATVGSLPALDSAATVGGGGQNQNYMSNSNASTVHRINQTTNPPSVTLNYSGTGFKSINRTTANDVVGFNGATRTDATAASTSIRSSNQVLLMNGALYGNAEISYYGMGAEMVTENSALQAALSTYLASL